MGWVGSCGEVGVVGCESYGVVDMGFWGGQRRVGLGFGGDVCVGFFVEVEICVERFM